MHNHWLVPLLAIAALLLVSALPGSTEEDTDPLCASPNATTDNFGPSVTSEKEDRGYVCRENGEIVASRIIGD